MDTVVPYDDGMTSQERKDRCKRLARVKGGCDHKEFDVGGWCRNCWASKHWLEGKPHPRPPVKVFGRIGGVEY